MYFFFCLSHLNDTVMNEPELSAGCPPWDFLPSLVSHPLRSALSPGKRRTYSVEISCLYTNNTHIHRAG